MCHTHTTRSHTHLHFVWQAWHVWHGVGSGGALGSRLPRYRRTNNSLTRTCFIRPCLSHSVFTFLWLLFGRSWHVGLSGPLFFHFLANNKWGMPLGLQCLSWKRRLMPRVAKETGHETMHGLPWICVLHFRNVPTCLPLRMVCFCSQSGMGWNASAPQTWLSSSAPSAVQVHPKPSQCLHRRWQKAHGFLSPTPPELDIWRIPRPQSTCLRGLMLCTTTLQPALDHQMRFG